ncbi:unnamed protein product [Trichobilharzia szidati]|nr:unnamed protein product [Trichobilharzia szidati]
MNPSVSGHYPLLRHDPVTARAISRLSHGVARLTASLNPEGQHRHFRTRRAKLGNRSVSESLSSDDSQYVATGSKRKWQPDKIELDTIMELEQSTTHSSKQLSPATPSRSTTTTATTTTTSPLIPSSIHLKHSSIDSTLRHVSISIDALNLQTKLLTPFSYSNPILQKSLSSDNIESTGRYSSGSSMLSVTTSSDNSNNNNNNNNDNETDASSQDADVEDEDHNELISIFRSTTTGRSTFTSKVVSSRRKLSLFDKHFYDVWKPFDDSVYSCGGDSSDGLSINIKMPRLSSTYFHNNNSNNTPGLSDYSSRLSPISSSQSTRRYTRGMLASSSSDTTNHRRRVKCKCKLRNNEHHTNAADCHKSGKCHRNCSHSSSTSSSSLSTEESSDENCSKGFSMHKHRYTSIADSQKNCNKDRMKVAGIKYTKKCPTSSTSTEGGSHKSSIVQSELQHLPTDSSMLTLDEPVDPEWDNILNGTWPLLSNCAKQGYAKAMLTSNSKRYSNSQKRKTSNMKNKDDSKSINNSNSKGHLYAEKEIQIMNTDDCQSANVKPNQRMPTPPWLVSDDNESVRDSDEFDETDLLSDRGKMKTSTNGMMMTTTYNQRPCLDNWKPELSSAAPLNDTNKGHRMLQRLGWKPGDGLGQNSDGLITPVNCVKAVKPSQVV